MANAVGYEQMSSNRDIGLGVFCLALCGLHVAFIAAVGWPMVILFGFPAYLFWGLGWSSLRNDDGADDDAGGNGDAAGE